MSYEKSRAAGRGNISIIALRFLAAIDEHADRAERLSLLSQQLRRDDTGSMSDLIRASINIAAVDQYMSSAIGSLSTSFYFAGVPFHLPGSKR